MPLTLVLPDRYEYVALAGVASVFLTAWQGTKVSRQRKKAGIKYPQLYAEKAEMEANKEARTFNNLQRAHQNTLETYSQFLTCLFITGLKYPEFAAGMGGAWIVGRIFYTWGYKTHPDKRNSRGGIITQLAGLILPFSAAWVVIDQIRPRFAL